MVETSLESGRLAKVATKAHDEYSPVVAGDFRKQAEGAVAAAIVDKDDFKGLADCVHDVNNPDVELGNTLLLVVKRHDDGISDRATFGGHAEHCSTSIGR